MRKVIDRTYLKALFKRIMLHVLFWALIVMYFAWGFGFQDNYKASILNAMFYLPGDMLMVYILIYFLVPRYLINKKYFKFFIGLLLALGCCALYAWTTHLALSPNEAFKGFNMTVGMNVLPFVHVSGIAISIKLLSFWYKQKQQTIEARQQRTQAELDMLKTQLHPHFLFNTLNNLYAYTLEQSPKAPEIVLKLSALLRFMIYESNARFITLNEEIDLLQHYIELEKLRYGDRLDISFVINGQINNYQIAPLLLLPLLTDDVMNFKLVNSVDKEPGINHNTGGVGLNNVKRRLDLLYEGKFRFETLMQDEVFIVDLQITLQNLTGDDLKKQTAIKAVSV
jgi:hypothetical protein